MDRNEDKMSSKKSKNRNKNTNKTTKSIEIEKEKNQNEMDEVDKILDMIDRMEKEKKSKGGSAEMSSRVKNLIKEDKEAIKEMQEKMKALEDDLDYLDDEKIEDSISESEEKELDNDGGNDDSDSEDEGAKLDFFANLEKKDNEEQVNIYAERIRKKQPKRLKKQVAEDDNFISKVKRIAAENTKNFVVGTAIAFLFVALVIALLLDSGNSNNEQVKSNKKSPGDFVEINTAGMIDAVNKYFKALSSGDKEVIKKSVVNPENLSDDEIAGLVSKAEDYSKVVGDGFKITDCYVQQGLKEYEYICYIKFEIKLKSIETPAVGMFTCYLKDVTKEELEKSEEAKVHIYKLDYSINDDSSDVYKYVIKMSKCSNVTGLFNRVNEELAQACEKDPGLKNIVDVLNGSGDENEIVDKDTTQEESESGGEETTEAPAGE